MSRYRSLLASRNHIGPLSRGKLNGTQEETHPGVTVSLAHSGFRSLQLLHCFFFFKQNDAPPPTFLAPFFFFLITVKHFMEGKQNTKKERLGTFR